MTLRVRSSSLFVQTTSTANLRCVGAAPFVRGAPFVQAFTKWKEHIINGALDLSPRAVQDGMRDTLLAFMEKSGAQGFAWDHNIYAGGTDKRYAQWRAWMRILVLRRHSRKHSHSKRSAALNP